MTTLSSRKAEFKAWLDEHMGCTLSTADVVDKAAEIFTRQTYSVAISRTAIPDQEFKGDTFKEKRDGKRLRKQQATIERVVGNGDWWTLAAISEATGYPEASISARLRDADHSGRFRKEKRNCGGGLWQYRLTETP